jgi:pyruvate,water dikinase
MGDYKYVLFFNEIELSSIAEVGGKNASLGEMYNQLGGAGIRVPNGFAVTAAAYRLFRSENKLEKLLNDLLLSLDKEEYSNLSDVGRVSRKLILASKLPDPIELEIRLAYQKLSRLCKSNDLGIAVRSSATSEDLPTASFAGQMESYLNISGEEQLLKAVKGCFVSLFTDRAIKYRYDMGFEKLDIAISVGVQQMVRSDKGASGVAFTIDTDSGFENTIIINGIICV